MGEYKQKYPGVNRSGTQYNTPLPNAEDNLSFNERRLDSARNTTHVADAFGNQCTETKQGMKYFPMNADNMGETHMPNNQIQAKDSDNVYPNNISIKARDASGGKNYA